MSTAFHIEARSESNAYHGFADPRDALSVVSVAPWIEGAATLDGTATAAARQRIVAGQFWLLSLEAGRAGWRAIGPLIPAQREFRSLLESGIGVMPASLVGWLQRRRLAEGRPLSAAPLSEAEQFGRGRAVLLSHEAMVPDRRRARVLVLLDAAAEPRAVDFSVMRVDSDGISGQPLRAEIAHLTDGTCFVTTVLQGAPQPARSQPGGPAPEMCRNVHDADLPAGRVLLAERRGEQRVCLSQVGDLVGDLPGAGARGLRRLGIGRATMAEPPGLMRIGHGLPVLQLAPGAPAAPDWQAAPPGVSFATFEAWAANRANLCRMTGSRGSLLPRILQRLRVVCAAFGDSATMALLDALPDPAVGGLLVSLVPVDRMSQPDGPVDWRGVQPLFRSRAPYHGPQIARLAEMAMQAIASGDGCDGPGLLPTGRALVRAIHAAASLTLRARTTPKPLLIDRPCGAVLAGLPAGGIARLHVRPLVAETWFDDMPMIDPAVRQEARGFWSDDGTGYTVFDGAALTLAVPER
ncbi:MAG: hypothetical protein IAE87_09325 [Rhodobacteraceae bacterium]|jgi:hypothetical protein|nr:hypothetical protein [Paracoccaceae bacterium]